MNSTTSQFCNHYLKQIESRIGDHGHVETTDTSQTGGVGLGNMNSISTRYLVPSSVNARKSVLSVGVHDVKKSSTRKRKRKRKSKQQGGKKRTSRKKHRVRHRGKKRKKQRGGRKRRGKRRRVYKGTGSGNKQCPVKRRRSAVVCQDNF